MTLPRLLVGALALTLVTAAGHAAQLPQPIEQSPVLSSRIKVFSYGVDAIYPIPMAFGVQLMIRFSPDERIENVSIGDGAAWQVTPNKSATLLFVKPVEMSAGTNMTVVTSQRSYLFELVRSLSALDAPYLARFDYPPPPPRLDDIGRPERKNAAYTFSGARSNLPADVFDDGRFTYFRWPETAATPAVFAVDPDGAESLVNYSLRGEYQVVETIAPRFLLRNGAEVTTVSNQGWAQVPHPGDDKQP